MGFFGLYGATAALATTLTLASVLNCIDIGFQYGTHTHWQLVVNDDTGAPTLMDIGASFGIATAGALTLFIAAPPNGSSVWLRVMDEVFEQEIKADLPAEMQFLSPAFTSTPARRPPQSLTTAPGSIWRRISEWAAPPSWPLERFCRPKQGSCRRAVRAAGDTEHRYRAADLRFNQRALQQVRQRDRALWHEGEADPRQHHGLHPVFAL